MKLLRLRPSPIILILMVTLSAASACCAQKLPVVLKTDRLTLLIGDKRNISLTVDGVTVIRESGLYLVQPGWAGTYLDQDKLTPMVTATTGGAQTATVDGAQSVTAKYETPDAQAETLYELGADDSLKVTLRFRMKTDKPAEVEYTAGYLNADLLKGMPFTAETIDGPREGFVPLFAKSSDQTASRLTPLLKSIRFETAIGPMEISVTGNSRVTSTLNLFDAREEDANWGRNNPILWLGIGSPSLPFPNGENVCTVTYRFGPSPASKPARMLTGTTPVRALQTARLSPAEVLPIIPRPKQLWPTPGRMYLGRGTVIVIPMKACAEETAAARELREELKTFWGVDIPVKRGQPTYGAGPAGVIQLAVGKAPKGINVWSPNRPEAYAVVVDGLRAEARASDSKGVYFAAQTLKQMIRRDGKGVYLQGATIRDWPTMAFRGVHWYGGPDSWPFHERMINRIVAPLKFNTMVYEAEFTKWDSQPKIFNPQRGTPKEMVRKTLAEARAHFLEPIPLISAMGHTEWLFHNGQNLDFAADPTQPYAYDPTNPRAYDVLFGVMKETVDLFQSRVFHIGNDEVTMTGTFPPKGSNKSVTELVLEDTNRRYQWLKDRGIQTMMWSDMFLHSSEIKSAANAPSLEEARKRRAGLPKDIIIADWHYLPLEDFNSVPVWQKEGFTVVGCPWYQWPNIMNFARTLEREKSYGYLQTTWAGYAMSLDVVERERFQFAAYVLAAEAAWNGGARSLEQLGWSADQAFAYFWDRTKEGLNARPGSVVDLSGISNIDWWDWTAHLPGAKTAARSANPVIRKTLDGIVFKANKPVLLWGPLNSGGPQPMAVSVSLGSQKAEDIAFLWGATANAPWFTPVARLRLTYADGRTEDKEIQYGKDIAAFTDKRSSPEAVVSWSGKSPWGEAVNLRRWLFRNPRPDVAIKEITLTTLGTEAAPVLLGVTTIQ